MSTLSLIVAYSDNHVIGIDNDLPWRLKADLAYFKKTTLGQPIIMGRKTWESLGRPLPGRRNIVISRDNNYQAEGAEVYSSLEEAIAQALNGQTAHGQVTDEQTANAQATNEQAHYKQAEIFIIGGAQIYSQALASNAAQRIYATEVHTEIEGDAFFPEFDKQIWQEVSRLPQAPENNLSYDFVVYERQA